jgi:hypothetical protein
LLANGIWRNFLLLSWRGSDRTGLKRRKDATSHIILDNLYLGDGRKIFNYTEALQDINIEEYLKNTLTCDCSHSPFQYNPSGHVITGDLNIIQHKSLLTASWSLNTDLGRQLTQFFSLWIRPCTRDLIVLNQISHGPKFREPQHINWKHKFKIIMDAVEDYARRWIKREVDQDPYLCLIPWLDIRSNMIYIQTRYCWKPCPQERQHICHEERKWMLLKIMPEGG